LKNPVVRTIVSSANLEEHCYVNCVKKNTQESLVIVSYSYYYGF